MLRNIIQRFDEIYANDTGLLPNHALNNSPIKIMGKLPGSNRDRNRKVVKAHRLLRCGIAADFGRIVWHDSELVIVISQDSMKSLESVLPIRDAEVLDMQWRTHCSGDQLKLDFSSSNFSAYCRFSRQGFGDGPSGIEL